MGGRFGCVETVSSEKRFVVESVLFSRVDGTILNKNEVGLGSIRKVFGSIKSSYMDVMAIAQLTLTSISNKRSIL